MTQEMVFFEGYLVQKQISHGCNLQGSGKSRVDPRKLKGTIMSGAIVLSGSY